MTVGKGPYRLPTAHFPHFPSTLSSMEGGSPSSWPPVPSTCTAPLPVSGLSGWSPQGPASRLSQCTAHNANPGRLWTCPHLAPPPNSSSVYKGLSVYHQQWTEPPRPLCHPGRSPSPSCSESGFPSRPSSGPVFSPIDHAPDSAGDRPPPTCL